MGTFLDETGKRYGKLTVIGFDHLNKQHNAYWLCACDCGLTTVVSGTYLRRGHTTSCGCVKRQYICKKHGYSDKEPLYGVWEQMRSRCRNRNNPRYEHYGAKGIDLCEEWNDYGVFREWAFANGYYVVDPDTPKKDRISIDRIDPSKGYFPDNCRWITVSENSVHRRKSHANQR